MVVGQINDACLDDEAAEFDQVSSALAALDLPSAHVIASPCRLLSIVGCPVALERCVRIPTKPAIDSDLKPASHSDFIPAGVPI
ncbi:hypothetical protein [Mesorhizobium jarvisii]|uniref:hypothetical protein n=1 Tax=Mesorhizobium jarvisii TaxID=1777867 RepID=UPI001F0ADE68|nr:hypothetical protein [Mesorhizobium jarvisii]